jgi:hypothetical protein
MQSGKLGDLNRSASTKTVHRDFVDEHRIATIEVVAIIGGAMVVLGFGWRGRERSSAVTERAIR